MNLRVFPISIRSNLRRVPNNIRSASNFTASRWYTSDGITSIYCSYDKIVRSTKFEVGSWASFLLFYFKFILQVLFLLIVIANKPVLQKFKVGSRQPPGYSFTQIY